MKHLRTLSRPRVSAAQLTPGEIVTLVTAILSLVVTIVGIVVPATAAKE